MSSSDKKNEHFKSLLPQIYKRLIIDGNTYLQVIDWLRDEEDLDLESKDGTPNLFSNYMSRYGDIKKAKESYQAMLKTEDDAVTSNWFEAFINTKKSKAHTDLSGQYDPNDNKDNNVKPQNVSEPERLVAEKEEVVLVGNQEPLQTQSSVNVASRYSKTPTKLKPRADISRIDDILNANKNNDDPLTGDQF